MEWLDTSFPTDDWLNETFDVGYDDARDGRPFDDTWLDSEVYRRHYRRGYEAGEKARNAS